MNLKAGMQITILSKWLIVNKDKNFYFLVSLDPLMPCAGICRLNRKKIEERDFEI